jgi:hypothetical protein
MMRTRQLHSRLAYVMRVENRARIAYAAASARTPRPPSGWASHRTLGLRYAPFARHAGSHHAQMASVRTLMNTLGKSLQRAPIPCDNHIQRENFSASSTPACSTITLDTMDCDPPYERMAAKSARVSGPVHFSYTAKLRSSALYSQVK